MDDVLCGSLAGAAGKVIEYPFDTAKVRLQTQNPANPTYRGPIDCIRTTLSAEGLRGLYRGMALPMAGAAAENATLFFTFTVFEKMTKPLGLAETPQALLCGCLGGLVASVVLTPIELLKCNTQVSAIAGIRHKTNMEQIRTILSHDGIRGLWKGQAGTAIREAGGSAAWFGSYRAVVQLLSGDKNSQDHSPKAWHSMLAGSVAGMAYNFSLFPADTVKSQMQTQRLMGRPDHGFVRTFFELASKGGVRSLYQGCGLTCARAAPSSAIIFLVYEQLKKVIKF